MYKGLVRAAGSDHADKTDQPILGAKIYRYFIFVLATNLSQFCQISSCWYPRIDLSYKKWPWQLRYFLTRNDNIFYL